MQKKEYELFHCTWCGKEISSPTKAQKDGFKRRGRVYCSKSCGKAYSKMISSQTMRETNLRLASKRMKEKNPMHNSASREKMRKSLAGRAPVARMGNGTGLTRPQEILLSKLSRYCPVPEYPISISGLEGAPTCYKVDIAIPNVRLAIEIDGSSHRAIQRRAEDKKKDAILHSLGWAVVRIKNEEVLGAVDMCVSGLEGEIVCQLGLINKSVLMK